MKTKCSIIVICVCISLLFSAVDQMFADRTDEIKVKRKEVFEFTKKPKVTRNGDNVTIRFTVKDFCDVTVAVEDNNGRMVRHVASGVLGENAPAPFTKNSKEQTIVWDGKNDVGRYIDDKDNITIRVSLGIKPQFERNLFWSPYKRKGAVVPLISPTPEGIYILDSRGANTIRLYDHNGVYKRTVHPPPSGKELELKGAEYKTSPQTGKKVVVLRGFTQGTFLSGADSCYSGDVTHHGDPIFAGTSFTVNPAVKTDSPRRIASAYLFMNRLAADGSTGEVPIEGPIVGIRKVRNAHWHRDYGTITVGPTSLAFSPDGKKLYMTGYLWNVYGNKGITEAIFHGVQIMDFESNDKPVIFKGTMTTRSDGSDNEHFAGPTSVACDAKGRVYVSDFLNSRIQVFSPEGDHLKTLLVKNPSKVMVSHKDGTIMAFSWPINCFSHRLLTKYKCKMPSKAKKGNMTWTFLGTFEKPKQADPKPLPITLSTLHRFHMGQCVEVTWDPWAEETTVWIAGRKQAIREYVVKHHGKLAWEDAFAGQWRETGIGVYILRNGKWEVKKDFDNITRKAIYRNRPAAFHGQRLSVNPADSKLYLLEYRGHLGMKSHKELLNIDPVTGGVTPVILPMSAETVLFDMRGDAYLRDDRTVMRFNSKTWREIPWDYGEERKKVGMAEKMDNAIGALALPTRMPCTGHQEGMWVSVKGNVAVSCFNAEQKITFTYGKAYTPGGDYKPYVPRLFPGRIRWGEIHIYDKHGKLLYEDAVPGLAHLSGLGMDEDDNLYILAAGRRVIDRKSPFNPWSGTLIKFKPNKGRIIGSNSKKGKINAPQVVLAPESYPKRTHDLENSIYHKAWVEDAEWFYGGIGYSGWSHTGSHRGNTGQYWDDWGSRFGFDRYSRSFVSEFDNYSIAVVDKNGNLIMRFGQYGNEQDGKPLIQEGGPVNPVSIGGSEVALARPMTMAVDSDRRLFVTDAMNAKILSIKIGYHKTERVQLKDVPESKGIINE